MGIAEANAAPKAYVGNFRRNTVSVNDPAAGVVSATIYAARSHGTGVSEVGRWLLVSGDATSGAGVVDITSVLTKTIAVGNAPRKAAVHPTSVSAASGLSVSTSNFTFAPTEIVVTIGARIEGSNADGAAPGLACKGGAPGVDPILSGDLFSSLFDKPDAYDWLCSLHPDMTRRIAVRAR